MKRLFLGLGAALALSVPAFAVEIGDDGLHKAAFFTATFKDVAEDIETATDEGKRHAIIFEQRGCIYCKKMHEEVFSDPDIAAYIDENFYVVQYNLYGDEEVTDLDGEAMTEKEMAERWRVNFTPTVIFLPEEAGDQEGVNDAEVARMPGAFGKGTTLDMFTWVREKGYEGDERFQRYHARKITERRAARAASSGD